MKFRVHGVGPDGTSQVRAVLDAPSEQKACAKANNAGIRVLRVEPMDIMPIPSSRTAVTSAGDSSNTLIIAAASAISGILVLVFLVQMFSGSSGGSATAQYTKAAWDQMVQIDLQLRPLYGQDQYQYWERKYTGYAQIDRDYVDRELAGLIEESMEVSLAMRNTIAEYHNRRNAITQGVDAATQLGALAGSMNRDDPQGGSAAGALLFGLFGAAAADNRCKQLNAEFEPIFQNILKRTNDLDQRQVLVAQKLSRRYSIPFHR